MPSRNGSGTPSLERYFTYRLNTLSRLNDVASQDLYLSEGGLSLPETRCLAAVGSFPELTVNQLSFEANLDKGQASRAAQSLCERGLLTKTLSTEDRRSVRLALTPEGRVLWKKVMALIDQRNRVMLECLTKEQQQQLLQMFDAMLAHAQRDGR
jgi:DNA-binding MarR family transcriptional regulator